MPNWELVSFVMASEMRFKVLLGLKDRVRTPTDLKKEFNAPISRVSAVLKELIEKDLVENLTPDRRKSKMYSITEKGKEILSEIHELTGSGDQS